MPPGFRLAGEVCARAESTERKGSIPLAFFMEKTMHNIIHKLAGRKLIIEVDLSDKGSRTRRAAAPARPSWA